MSPPPEVVVDADGHVVEPREAWSAVPAEYRPTIEHDTHGYEHVVVDGKEILAVPLGSLATPGARFSDPDSFLALEEAHRGGWDPLSRLADMDVEGIDQAVLFPSVGLYFWALDDPRAAVPIARAYNDWLASYCAADPTRLFGAAMLPVQDPAAAVAELRRARHELGFVAAFVRPNPCCGRSLSDRAYEPLWDAAEESAMA
ncbi:MAG TPA: amidohydrolase family protein, partial [Acidimicrobiales bacterium]|nr:amidohydrolase family protein [Acidimicrobiales bacterium]